jgi:hypothetical protein
MGIGGMLILLVAALTTGFVIQLFGKDRTDQRWLGTGSMASIGGYVASEFLWQAGNWGWQWDGLAVLPAIVAVLVVAMLTEAAAQRLIDT